MFSAIARRVRAGDLGREDAESIARTLDEDLGSFTVVDLTAAVVARSRALLARHPLRAGGAVQLATCLHVGERVRVAPVFVAADDRVLHAARAEGLRTLIPR